MVFTAPGASIMRTGSLELLEAMQLTVAHEMDGWRIGDSFTSAHWRQSCDYEEAFFETAIA